MQNDSNRRTFLKTSAAAAAAGAALTSTVARTAHAAGSDEIRFVLIGCGGRGTGAADEYHEHQRQCQTGRRGRSVRDKAATQLAARLSKGKYQGQGRRTRGPDLRRARWLQEGDRCRLRSGRDRDPPGIQAAAIRVRGQQGQAHLHGEAGRLRCARRPAGARLGRGIEEEEPDGRDRPAAPPRTAVHGDGRAHARRRDRRHHRPACLLERRRHLVPQS